MAALRAEVVARDFREEAEEPLFRQGLAAKPRLVGGSDARDQRLARLAGAIEREVVPRLILARRAAPIGPPGPSREAWTPSAEDVTEFAGLVLAHEVVVASSYVEAARARGASAEALYLELLAPAARHLGELWTADLCDFTEVTVGLCRLHQVLRELSPVFQNEGEHQPRGRRALLVPVPGEQHTFGLVMVAEFFRRAGWDVWCGPLASRGELVGIVRREWFAVVGFSACCDTRLEALASGIHAVRRASRNPAIGVLVGGPVFVEHPDLAPLIGADATAVDGRQATCQAENLLALFAAR
jgi:MerR family transcriptional regulator, light-induced transcriptional regulator